MKLLYGIYNKRNDKISVQSYMETVKNLFSLYSEEIIYPEAGIGLITNCAANSHSCFIKEYKQLSIGYVGESDTIENDVVITNKISNSSYNPKLDVLVDCYKNNNLVNLRNMEGIDNIIVWDSQKSKFSIIGDKFGFRSFYYYEDNNVFLFSTYIKTILLYSKFERELNEKVLFEILKYGLIIPGDTLIKNIYILPTDKYIIYEKSLQLIGFPKRVFKALNYSHPEELYIDFLTKSINKRVDSSKNNAILLSGGIDSAAIVGINSLSNNAKFTAYTIDLSEKQNELIEAKRIAGLFNLQIHPITHYNSSIMKMLPKVIECSEMIGVNIINCVIEYLFTKSIASDNSCVFTGDGNDGIWGFSNYFTKKDLMMKGLRVIDVWIKYRQLLPERIVNELLNPDISNQSLSLSKIENIYLDTGNCYNDLINLDSKIYSENVPKRMIGRLRLDASIQTFKFPYLDSDLIEFVDSLPIEEKVFTNGKNKISKFLFKKTLAANNLLPLDIIYKQKSWMYSPVPQWLRGELGDSVSRILFDKNAIVNDYLNMTSLKNFFELHKSGKTNFAQLILTVLGIEIWYKIFIQNNMTEIDL